MNTLPLRVTVVSAAAILFWISAAAAQPIPVADHVVIAVMENRAYGQIIGSPSAPYINSLLPQGALLTNAFALTHPSQPNYAMMFSGSSQGIVDNSTPTNLPFTTPNLGAQLITAGRTFAGYSEDQPSIGFTGDSAGGPNGYVRRHNPWVNWQQVGAGPHPANTLLPTTNLPFTAFPSDYSTLPTLSFVVPNLLNDMHDGSVAQGDAWLSANLDGYVQWARTHNSVFILTFDEDDGSAGNQIATILLGQTVRQGVTSGQLIDHYGMLATYEDMFGLPRIANSIGASSLVGIWTPVPEPSAFVLTAVAGLVPGAISWRRKKFGRGRAGGLAVDLAHDNVDRADDCRHVGD